MDRAAVLPLEQPTTADISATSLNISRNAMFDSSGNLYIADYSNNRVLYYPSGSTTATRVYGQAGSFTTNTANNGGISANSLYGPMVLPSTAAATSISPILATTASSTMLRAAPPLPASMDRLAALLPALPTTVASALIASISPDDIALDSSGNLYVADTTTIASSTTPLAARLPPASMVRMAVSPQHCLITDVDISATSLYHPLASPSIAAAISMSPIIATTGCSTILPAARPLPASMARRGSFTTNTANNGASVPTA